MTVTCKTIILKDKYEVSIFEMISLMSYTHQKRNDFRVQRNSVIIAQKA